MWLVVNNESVRAEHIIVSVFYVLLCVISLSQHKDGMRASELCWIF